MVEAGEIVQAVMVTLTPLLPYLAKAGTLAGKSFTEGAAKAAGEATWKAAQSLWARMHGAAADDLKLKNSMDLVAADPDDEISIAAFKKNLEARLARDAAFKAMLVQDLGGELSIQTILAQDGAKISAVQQDLQGAGDQSIVARGEGTIVSGATQIRRP